jgi:PTS system nitrogen regulatory IIA component
MLLLEFLSPEAVASSLRANGKKQVLQDVASAAARLTGIDESEIFETLLQRERLGSTGIGEGVAIPHGKLAKLEGMFGFLAKLDKPVDFDAIDGQPVDIVFLLLAPEGAGADHLKALARVARILRTPGVLDMIRTARDDAALYAVLSRAATPQAA